MTQPALRSTRTTGARSLKVRAVSVPDEPSKRVQDFPPTEYSEQLAVDNIRLAQQRAHLMMVRTGMPFDDLYQVALVGLIKGCRRYDPNKISPKTGEPYKLSTIAVTFIEGAMMQYLRDRGHSSGVKFPDRWRDKASIVRKMTSDGAQPDVVASATGLRVDEIKEILEAQSSPAVLDPDVKLYSNEVTVDEPSDCYELAQALEIVDRAHSAISIADQNMLEAAWNHPRRRQIAVGPFFQFMNKAKRIIKGAPIVSEEQIDLSIEIRSDQHSDIKGCVIANTKRVSEPKEILKIAETQLDLF